MEGSGIARPLAVGQDPHGPQDVVEVVHGLAHAHEDHVLHRLSQNLPGHQHLGHDLAGIQVAQVAESCGLAEGAAHLAAHLRRHAQRLVRPHRDHHRLALQAVAQAQQELVGRSIARSAAYGWQPHGELRSHRLRQRRILSVLGKSFRVVNPVAVDGTEQGTGVVVAFPEALAKLRDKRWEVQAERIDGIEVRQSGHDHFPKMALRVRQRQSQIRPHASGSVQVGQQPQIHPQW
jgi:hypothetical protein